MGTLGTGEPPDRGRSRKGTSGQMWSDMMMEETGDFKFYRINLKGSTDSFYKQNVFLYDKIFANSDGFLEKKFMSATSMLVKVTNGSRAESQLKNMNRISISGVEAEVEVKEVASLNSSQGTIFAPELNATSPAEIIAMNEHIREIERMTRWDPVLMKRVNTDRYKITFNARNIPEKVNLGFLRFSVRQYYPLPRGCLACLKYDHMFRSCPQKDVAALCRKCGINAGLDQVESKKQDKRVLKSHKCQEPPKCPNCPDGQNGHGSTSPECQARKKESEIIKLKIDHNLSYGEARKRVNDPSFRSTGQTFTQVMSGTAIREQVEALWSAKERELSISLDIEDIEEVTENIRKLIEKRKQAILTLNRQKEELRQITKGYRQPEDEEYMMDIESVIEIHANNTQTGCPVVDLTEQPGMSKQTTTSSKTKPKPPKKNQNKPLKYKELEILKDPTKTKEVTQANMVTIYASLTPLERQKIKNLREISRREQKTLVFLADDEFLYSQWK